MRILFVGDAAVSTGFAKCTHVVCDELHNAGHDVHVLGVNYFGDPHDYSYPIYPCRQPFDDGRDSIGITRLPKLVDRLKPDVVVLLTDPWNIKEYTDYLNEVKVECGKLGAVFSIPPIVAWLAVDSCNQKGEELNSLSHVIVWTEFAANELQVGGCTVETSIVPLGVNTDLYFPRDKSQSRHIVGSQLPQDSFVVGTVGRNQPRKRLDLAIEYFAGWIKTCAITNAYLYLYVAPTGERGCDIKQIVKYYGLTGKVILNEPHVGHGNHESVLPFVYSSFDVYLTTSQGEGWGLPVLEAMACGVPCVVPDSAALGKDGGWTWDAAIQIPCSSHALTAPLNGRPYTIGGIPNKQDTVAALQMLHTNSAKRRFYSDAGMKLSAALTWNSTGKLFREVLESVMSEQAEKTESEAA